MDGNSDDSLRNLHQSRTTIINYNYNTEAFSFILLCNERYFHLSRIIDRFKTPSRSQYSLALLYESCEQSHSL